MYVLAQIPDSKSAALSRLPCSTLASPIDHSNGEGMGVHLRTMPPFRVHMELHVAVLALGLTAIFGKLLEMGMVQGAADGRARLRWWRIQGDCR